ncbi:MAG: hypothetical protein AAF828_03755 [Bacteroidota bacterium]
MPAENEVLQRCLAEIERQVGWGKSATWTHQDFEELSEKMLEKTGVQLSSTTLKRVWGRVQYHSQPSVATLNALAIFLGYANWRAYRLASTPATPSATVEQATTTSSAGWRLVTIGIVALLLIVFGLAVAIRPAPPITPPNEAFSFDFRRTAAGLPNSVVFEYDASMALADEVFIQQSWDDTRRKRVAKDGRTHTSIYYEPGYFEAKLIVGDQIVQEKPLYIPSEEWVCTVNQQPVPVYFPPEVIGRKHLLTLTENDLTQRNIQLQPQLPVVRFSKVPTLPRTLFSHDFSFSTRLRHDYQVGSAACQYANIIILLNGNAINIPLSTPGCIANLDLYYPGKTVAGSSQDLSGFGLFKGTGEWIELNCTVSDGQITFTSAGQEIYRGSFTADKPYQLIGLRFQFMGLGSVDQFQFIDGDGNVIWEEKSASL